MTFIATILDDYGQSAYTMAVNFHLINLVEKKTHLKRILKEMKLQYKSAENVSFLILENAL